jgi:hypothetical protein
LAGCQHLRRDQPSIVNLVWGLLIIWGSSRFVLLSILAVDSRVQGEIDSEVQISRKFHGNQPKPRPRFRACFSPDFEPDLHQI